MPASPTPPPTRRPPHPAGALQRARAREDYLRFKQAYERLCAAEPENDIGRMMIGADLERAMRVLEELDEEEREQRG